MRYETYIPGRKKQEEFRNSVSKLWVEAAGQSSIGNQTDYNMRDDAGTHQQRGGGYEFQHAVKDGTRQSTARELLLPLLDRNSAAFRPNLHVVVNAHVRRVILEDITAAEGTHTHRA